MDNLDPHGLGQYVSPVGVGAAFISALGWLPVLFGTLGGIAAFIYYVITIWEKQTVQNWVKTRAARRFAAEVAALEVDQSRIVGRLKELGVLTHAVTDVQHDDRGGPVSTTTSIETNTLAIKK